MLAPYRATGLLIHLMPRHHLPATHLLCRISNTGVIACDDNAINVVIGYLTAHSRVSGSTTAAFHVDPSVPIIICFFFCFAQQHAVRHCCQYFASLHLNSIKAQEFVLSLNALGSKRISFFAGIFTIDKYQIF